MRHTMEESLARMKKTWPKTVTPTVEVFLSIYRLNDLARANARRQMSRRGLSLTDIDVLAALRSAPPAHELSPTDVALTKSSTNWFLASWRDQEACVSDGT